MKRKEILCCSFSLRPTILMDVKEEIPLPPIHGSCRMEFLMTPVPITLPRISNVPQKTSAETAPLQENVLPCRISPRYTQHSKLVSCVTDDDDDDSSDKDSNH